MARALAISLVLALSALAAPAAAHADGYTAAHDMCGGGGGGGGSGEFGAQDASIPPPPYDPDCDLVGSGPDRTTARRCETATRRTRMATARATPATRTTTQTVFPTRATIAVRRRI